MFSFDDLSNELQFKVPKERQFIYNLGTSDQSKNSNGLYLQVSFFFDFFGFCLRLSRAVGKRATCSHSQAGEVGVRRYCELQFSSVLAHPSLLQPPATSDTGKARHRVHACVRKVKIFYYKHFSHRAGSTQWKKVPASIFRQTCPC